VKYWAKKAELLDSGMNIVLTGFREGRKELLGGDWLDVTFGVVYTIEGIDDQGPYFTDNVGDVHHGLGANGGYEWEFVDRYPAMTEEA
jgi:hypothetical protein